MFVDDTEGRGPSSLCGLGGCATLASAIDRVIRSTWREIRRSRGSKVYWTVPRFLADSLRIEGGNDLLMVGLSTENISVESISKNHTAETLK